MDLKEFKFLMRVQKRFWKKVEFPENFNYLDCWIWKGRLDSAGHYGQFDICDLSSNAHRIIYMLYYGYMTNEIKIRHKCDNMLCVNPWHLEEGTQFDNVQDSIQRKRFARGSKRWAAKLNEQNVHEMLSRIKNKEFKNVKEIAKFYNVSLDSIYSILDGKYWTHVTDDYKNELKRIKNIVVGF